MSATEAAVQHGEAVVEHGAAAAQTLHHAAEAAGHGGGHATGGIHAPELQNLLDYVRAAFTDKGMYDDCIGHGFWGLSYFDVANIFFAMLIAVTLGVIAWRLSRNLKKVPTGFQALAEVFVGGMQTYFCGIMGNKLGKIFTPFVGTIFIYILCMNYIGLIPFAKSPIALNINVPASMAICVFFLVQYHGIRQNGIKKYAQHFVGETAGIPVLDQFLILLNIFLHIFGELVKPASLTLRLFGNISGEDAVVAALVGLVVALPWYAPVPIQTFFFPLALLFGLIQAIVFSTLSAVYLLLMSAHEEH
ncbi:MAG TPA: F0F1 ATP synthase subunit A [bacterium]|nr:F0F1 ATP synthase subunit A [bacterium]